MTTATKRPPRPPVFAGLYFRLDQPTTIMSKDGFEHLFFEITADPLEGQRHLLDLIVEIFTGLRYHFRQRPASAVICVDGQCRWFHPALQANDPRAGWSEVLIQHPTDRSSFLLLTNTMRGLEVQTNGVWKERDKEIKDLLTQWNRLPIHRPS